MSVAVGSKVVSLIHMCHVQGTILVSHLLDGLASKVKVTILAFQQALFSYYFYTKKIFPHRVNVEITGKSKKNIQLYVITKNLSLIVPSIQ